MRTPKSRPAPPASYPARATSRRPLERAGRSARRYPHRPGHRSPGAAALDGLDDVSVAPPTPRRRDPSAVFAFDPSEELGNPSPVERRKVHAALRHLSVARPALLHLLRRVEAEVGMARALVSKLTNAEYLRVEHRADGIQQVGEAARSSTVPRSRRPMREPDRGRRSTLPLPLSVSCSFPSSLRPAELIPTLAQYRQCVNVSM